MNNFDLHIALVADINYAEQVQTLIKSVCHFHRRVRFYLLHRSFSLQWFVNLNQKLTAFDSDIINVQINGDFSSLKTLNHISEATFYRFLIPDLPADKILYLDCDMIVNQSLDELYHTNLGDYPLAAVPDFFINHEKISHGYQEIPQLKPYFNAGVLLINNKLWKEQGYKDRLNQLAHQFTEVKFGDQDILNILIGNNWLVLDKKFNYQTGARFSFYENHLTKLIDEVEDLHGEEPVIVHFTGAAKPWSHLSNPVFLWYSELYWKFWGMEWYQLSISYDYSLQNARKDKQTD